LRVAFTGQSSQLKVTFNIEFNKPCGRVVPSPRENTLTGWNSSNKSMLSGAREIGEG